MAGPHKRCFVTGRSRAALNAKDQTSKIDASEQTFQKTLEEQTRKESALKKEKELQPKTEKPGSPASTLAPSLANNPCYNPAAPGLAKDRQDFESNKPVLISRLMQGGFTKQDAERMLAESSSTEELVLDLMNDGKTYGEASDLARTK